MRALTPRKVLEDAGAQAIVDRFALWFGEAHRVDLRETHTSRTGERVTLTYSLRTSDEEGAFDIEQHAFLDTRAGRIHRIDLLCSGFQAVDEKRVS